MQFRKVKAESQEILGLRDVEEIVSHIAQRFYQLLVVSGRDMAVEVYIIGWFLGMRGRRAKMVEKLIGLFNEKAHYY